MECDRAIPSPAWFRLRESLITSKMNAGRWLMTVSPFLGLISFVTYAAHLLVLWRNNTLLDTTHLCERLCLVCLLGVFTGNNGNPFNSEVP